MKLKFSSLRHDDNRRYWMLSLLTKQRDVHFAFVPSLWREFYFDKEGRQFLDNDIRYCLAIGIIQIIIHDYTGTKWIHLIVDEKRTYHPISRKEEIDHFKNCLKIFSSDVDPYISSCSIDLPMKFNWSEKPDGSEIYYLIVRQDFLIENNYGMFLNMRYPEVWMSAEDISYYFPSRWRIRTIKKIPYKKIELYETGEDYQDTHS